MIIDTHCHLDNFYHDSHPFTSISTSPLIAMSVSPQSWLPLLQFQKQFDQVYASLGIHPWFVTKDSLSSLALLRKLLSSENVTCLGEIGLDFTPKYKTNSSLQIELLNAQLQLAADFGKPVSLHVVKAHNEVLKLLDEYSVCGVVHGLGSSTQIAKHYIDKGFKIGVNGILLRANARRYHDLVRAIGLDNIVLETDFPNVCLPEEQVPDLCDIQLVAEKVADLLALPAEHVITQCNNNAQSTFKLNGI